MGRKSQITLRVRRHTFNVSVRKNMDAEGNSYNTYRTFLTKSLQDGKKKRIEVSAPTLDELREKLSEIQMPHRLLEVDMHSNEKVGDCYRRWFELSRIKWAESTQRQYENMGDNYILPYFGHLTMGEFDENVIRQFVGDRLEEDVSINRIAKVISHLGCFCRDMETSHYLPYDPCSRISLPRRQKTEQLALSFEQEKKFNAAAFQDVDCKLLSLMLQTAIRIGEATPIHESQVDRENHRLHIDRHTIRGYGGEKVEKTTKNGSTRWIPLTNEAIAIIDDAIRVRDLRREVAGNLWDNSDEGLIFTNSIGRRHSYNTVEKRCKRLAKSLHYNGVTTHTLRRTAATRFYFELGGDILAVSKILGHSGVSITEDYICPNMLDYEEWAKRLSHSKDDE